MNKLEKYILTQVIEKIKDLNVKLNHMNDDYMPEVWKPKALEEIEEINKLLELFED